MYTLKVSLLRIGNGIRIDYTLSLGAVRVSRSELRQHRQMEYVHEECDLIDSTYMMPESRGIGAAARPLYYHCDLDK